MKQKQRSKKHHLSRVIILAFSLIVLPLYFLIARGRTKPYPQQPSPSQTTDFNLRNIPNPNDQPPEENTAVPQAAIEMPPALKNKIRIFEIIAEKDALSPSKIIVAQGDIVRIRLVARDRNYSISLPQLSIFQEVVKGETGQLEFQALSVGSFDIHCSNCQRQVSGTFIVAKKE